MATVPLKKLPPDLIEILDKLIEGEPLTFVDESGKAKVKLVTVVSEQAEPLSKFQPIHDEWFEDWDRMAREISKAWKVDKSAVEILSEMRR